MSATAGHWDEAYRARGVTGVSWFQPEPALSLELVHVLNVGPSTPVIDIGGGASTLVDHLVAEGFRDVSVLDISPVALRAGEERLGPGAPVQWLNHDILTWRPQRRFGLWHDRAVFHFLVDADDRAKYVESLSASLEPEGLLIIATFAEDGPSHCSGLPVARYSTDLLMSAVGQSFSLLEERRELHTTPAGAVQPFTWVAARWHGK